MPKRLHDRASIVFPDSLKAHIRDFLIQYRKETGLGYKRLRNVIMAKEDADYLDASRKPGFDERREHPDTLLTNSDIRIYLSGTSQLGDNKFQYVDIWVRGLDQSQLSPECRGLLRCLTQHQTSFSLARHFGGGAYSTAGQKILSQRFERKVFAKAFVEYFPPYAHGMPIENLRYECSLWLLFTHTVQGACVAADFVVTLLDRPAFDQDIAEQDALTTFAVSPSTCHLMASGSLVVTMSGAKLHEFAMITGFMLLQRSPPPSIRTARLRHLKLPVQSATTFSLEAAEWRPPKPAPGEIYDPPIFETAFPLLHADVVMDSPWFRPWSHRTRKLDFVEDLKNVPQPATRLAHHIPQPWNQLELTEQLDDIGNEHVVGWDPSDRPAILGRGQ